MAMTPTHAWAPRGKRAIGSVPTTWDSTTMIAALVLDGVRAPLVFPVPPTLDRCWHMSIRFWHRSSAMGTWWSSTTSRPARSKVAESIGRVGASVLPLPPYSSDYDPIEELWSKLKGQLRRIAASARELVQCCSRDPGQWNAPRYPRLVQPHWTVRNSCVNRAGA